MSVSSINVSFNGHRKNFSLQKLPKIDEAMHSALSSLNLNPPPSPSLKKLTDRVTGLSKAKALMQKANDHSIRDKALSILLLLGVAALVTLTVFGFMINPILGTACLIATLAYFVVCNVKALAMGRREMRIAQKGLSLFPIGLLFGPMILSYLLATRTFSLRSKIAAIEQETRSEIVNSIKYWKQIGAPLTKRIEEEKKRAERSFAQMKDLEVRSTQGEKDLIEYQELLERISKEVEKGNLMAQS